MEVIGSGTVRDVIDGRTLMLDDGRAVRFAGIEVPPGAGKDAAGRGADPGAETSAALRRLVSGKPVVVKGAESKPDRYGRLVGHVFVTGEGLERSVQRDMLAAGLAWVGARVGDRACAAALLAGEREAREARLGLWASPDHAPRRADNPAAILSHRGRFSLVEGKVLSVRESGGTIYMNFSRRWSEGFTVTIAKRNERMFSAAGLEPQRLERQRVRVRGWVEERGGPRIEATRPEQIELLARE